MYIECVDMGKRIYVGNLPWSVTRERLLELFKPFGEIEDGLVIANKYTGRSRGFGFVTYKNDSDAGKAISEIQGKEIEGRKIIVKEAMPMKTEQDSEMKAAEERAKKEKPEKKDMKIESKEEPVKEKKKVRKSRKKESA